MRSPYRRPAATAAIVWCGLFAAVHVFWALGGSVGLASSAGARIAASRPLAFVLLGLWGVAAALLLGAVLIAWCTRDVRWRRLGGVAIGVVGAALLARGVLVEVLLLADVGGVRQSVGADETRWSLLLWNPWFVLGGALWLAVARQLARQPPPAAGPQATPD